MKKGPYKVLSSEVKYKNPWIEVTEEKVEHDDGNEGLFGVIDYGRGVSVVALDSENNIYLIKEFYYALNEYGLQTPSGGIENNESSLDAAKKELLEETGIEANKWQEIGFVNPLTMILKSPAYLFIATDLNFGKSQEKDIEVVKMPFQEAYQMVMNSEITHAPSCVAILKAKELLKL